MPQTAPDPVRETVDPSGAVTLAFTRRIRAGCEREFEAWMKEITGAAARQPGYLGATVMKPAYESAPPGRGHLFTAVFRFDSEAHWQAWAASPERAALLARGDAISQTEREVQHCEGLDYWFMLPDAPAATAPPKWKMALLLTGIVFTLLQGIGPLYAPLGAFLHIRLVQLLTVATTASLVTWFVLPTATKLLRGWLFPKSGR